MRSFFRGVGSLVGDCLAWWWGLPLFLCGLWLAVSIADDAPGLALVIVGILCLPVAIVLVTAYVGTVLARERYERHRGEHDEWPDGDAGPE